MWRQRRRREAPPEVRPFWSSWRRRRAKLAPASEKILKISYVHLKNYYSKTTKEIFLSNFRKSRVRIWKISKKELTTISSTKIWNSNYKLAKRNFCEKILHETGGMAILPPMFKLNLLTLKFFVSLNAWNVR